jgi:hypothetical protein
MVLLVVAAPWSTAMRYIQSKRRRSGHCRDLPVRAVFAPPPIGRSPGFGVCYRKDCPLIKLISWFSFIVCLCDMGPQSVVDLGSFNHDFSKFERWYTCTLKT